MIPSRADSWNTASAQQKLTMHPLPTPELWIKYMYQGGKKATNQLWVCLQMTQKHWQWKTSSVIALWKTGKVVYRQIGEITFAKESIGYSTGSLKETVGWRERTFREVFQAQKKSGKIPMISFLPKTDWCCKVLNNATSTGLQDMRFNTIVVHKLDPTGIKHTQYLIITECSCSSRAHGVTHR